MGQQADPVHPDLGPKWVVPYTNKTLCIPGILFGGINPLPVSVNVYFLEDPLAFVKDNSIQNFKKQLRCEAKDSNGEY